MDAEQLGNDHGYGCPKCLRGDMLEIAALHWVSLCPNGTDDTITQDGSEEWDETSAAQCTDCGWAGTVENLLVVELEDH